MCYSIYRPKTVTYPSTNRAQRWATSFKPAFHDQHRHRHPRDDLREDVGVGVGVMECGLYEMNDATTTLNRQPFTIGKGT